MLSALSNNQVNVYYFPGVLHVLRRLALVRLGRESVHAAQVQGDVSLVVLDVFQADETSEEDNVVKDDSHMTSTKFSDMWILRGLAPMTSADFSRFFTPLPSCQNQNHPTSLPLVQKLANPLPFPEHTSMYMPPM